MENGKRPKVVIVGAGLGGIWAAKVLANAQVDVLLIDRNNYHTFLALLYQVAAAELQPENIIYPIRKIIRELPNVSFLMAEVENIDCEKKLVKTSREEIAYDYLILAAGSDTNYFNIPGVEEFSFPLKTIDESIFLRNHIISIFERAVEEHDEIKRKKMLSFVIVGGGATGVEFSGALSELVHRLLLKDYPMLDMSLVKVYLLEASDRLLSAMPENCRDYTAKHLKMMGVNVYFNAFVQRITKDEVYLRDGGLIQTETVVWAAGVCGVSFAKKLELKKTPDNRINVLPTLQTVHYENIYTAGDLAYLIDEEVGRPFPMVAQVALQQGALAAKNIMRHLNGEPLESFKYNDLGSMATIGRHLAVAKIGKKTYTGLFAWLLWLVVHLIRLVGYRNRVIVFINWMWNYFIYERAIPLIYPSKTAPNSKKNI
ncbi:MAG: NAD(P)/FAD-dependent oxidoreductase [bacterium]|nr:NAD(P)/FAD-dependent oxidoreductase [bacterium]